MHFAASISPTSQRWLYVSIYLCFIGAFASVSLIGLGTLVFFLTFLFSFRDRPWWREISQVPAFWPILGLMVAILLSIVLADSYAYLKPLGKLRYLFLFFLFVYAFSYLPEIQTHLLWLSLVLAIVLGVVSILQFFGIYSPVAHFGVPLAFIPQAPNFNHATGFVFHHVPFGTNMVVLFHLLAAFCLVSDHCPKVYRLGVGFAAIGILLSFSRGAWIGLVVSSLVVCLIFSRKYFFRLLVIGALVGATLLTVSPSVRGRVTDINLSANQERISLWKISWRMFKEAPLLGQGFHSFAKRREKYIKELNLDKDKLPIEAHSMYMDMLGGTGAIGITLFIVFLTSLWRLLYLQFRQSMDPVERAFSLGALGSLTSFMVTGIFDKQFYMTYTLVAILLVLAGALCVSYRNRSLGGQGSPLRALRMAANPV